MNSFKKSKEKKCIHIWENTKPKILNGKFFLTKEIFGSIDLYAELGKVKISQYRCLKCKKLKNADFSEWGLFRKRDNYEFRNLILFDGNFDVLDKNFKSLITGEQR